MGWAMRQRGPMERPSVKVEQGMPEDDEPTMSAGPAMASICA